MITNSIVAAVKRAIDLDCEEFWRLYLTNTLQRSSYANSLYGDHHAHDCFRIKYIQDSTGPYREYLKIWS